jgi:hypothetical protein
LSVSPSIASKPWASAYERSAGSDGKGMCFTSTNRTGSGPCDAYGYR